MDLKTKKEIYTKMNQAIVTCTKCRLCRNRKNAVPGEGSLNSDVVFIGEAPGANEDQQARPFVGRSGMLLNELLLKIGLSRKTVWIGNVVKCRPPENRDPMVDELRACKPYLDKQIELIDPKVIVTLGRFAMEYFLPGEKIAKAHGNLFKVKGKLIYPIYHPAAALRNGTIKDILTKDFYNLKKILKGESDSLANLDLGDKDSDQPSLF